MTYLDAFIIGTVAGLRGASGALAFGLHDRIRAAPRASSVRWAADYTFLLAIPAIVGAAGVEILSALRHQGPASLRLPTSPGTCLGAAVAGIVGYMTIGFLIRMVSTRKVHWFAIYCFVFGLVLIFFFPS